jgi:hypothetical protein
MHFKRVFAKRLAVMILALLSILPGARAQWVTQSVLLTNGWNAVYLHVNASHVTLDDTVGNDVNNPILEVWRWNPASSIQFTTTPDEPIDGGSQWMAWKRADSSAFQRLAGNSAYLVRVATNVSTYTWNIQGKPLAPANDWTTTGLNFIGFPTVSANPPTFDAFLSEAPALQQNAEIYYYRGGDLGPGNPARLLALRTTRVTRGQAFWIRSGTLFNEYFAPYKIQFQNLDGVSFGNSHSSASFRLKNLTSHSLTVSVKLLASEAPPSGSSAIADLPPLIIRGPVNPGTQGYTYVTLPSNTARSWTLPAAGVPGSEMEVVLGLNRSAIAAPSGSLLAGVLRFSDSLGFSQIDVAVSADVGSSSGLWIGSASVDQVSQYLKTYQRNGDNTPVVTTNGQYVVQNLDTNLTAVPRSFPLRLIVHNPDTGNARLFQHLFIGFDQNTNYVSANKESVLAPNLLAQARRISASHLPWSDSNQGWSFNGRIGMDTNLSATILLAHNDRASNPFIHSYHPDHDNLDVTFTKELSPGAESYTVRRDITLQLAPPPDDFNSLVNGAQSVTGQYNETITVIGLPRAGGTNDSRQFQSQGRFTLNRISESPTLTLVP